MSTFGISLSLALVAAFVVAWYLPTIPYANRLVLNPPADKGARPRRTEAASVSRY